MHNNNIFTNIPESAISTLQEFEELTPKFPESVMSALRKFEELTPKFPESAMSALRKFEELTPKFPESAMSALQTQAELASIALNALPESTIDYFCNLASYCDQLPTIDFANQMTVACNSICNAIESPSILQGSFDFLKRLNCQDDFIELTEEDYNSINTILKSSNRGSIEVPKSKMTVVDFIKSVLIPILSILLPMLLTIYYHKVDSIESQKQYIVELQLKEQELQLKEAELQSREEELRIKEQQLKNDIEKKEILENILIEFQNQSEYYKVLLLEPECPCVTPETPGEAPEPFAEVPEPPGEVPYSPDGTQDNDLSNPDASKSSGSAMHRE